MDVHAALKKKKRTRWFCFNRRKRRSYGPAWFKIIDGASITSETNMDGCIYDF